MFINRLIRTIVSGQFKGHFGQWAEDVLVRKIFPKNKKEGVYLDVGAYHPFKHSNTAFLWLKGWHGFNIDANPNTIKLFNKIRPTDKNIWAAIIPHADYLKGIREAEFMTCDTNDYASGVFARGTCNRDVGIGRGFNKAQKVPAKSILQIIVEYNIREVDYLNIDIEGYDEEIVRDFDFAGVKPRVVSVEDYSENVEKIVSSNISKLLFAQGYTLIGRAGLTSVFCGAGDRFVKK